MQNYLINTMFSFLKSVSILKPIVENFLLIKTLAYRDISSRYKGSMLGILWSLLNPLFMLLVYTFIFGVIFKARWDIESNSHTDFSIILFSGLIIFYIFSDSISRSSTLILDNANYVKKVLFPLEVLPFIILGNTLFQFLLNFIILMIAYTIFVDIPHIEIILFPIILLPYCIFLVALIWVISAIGVYFRDISQIVNILIMSSMFLTPIFYKVSMIPESFRSYIFVNPITTPVEMFRNLFLYGQLPNLTSYFIFFTLSFIFAKFSLQFFCKLKKGFADVI